MEILAAIWLEALTGPILALGLGQALNRFDLAIVSFLNQFAHRSWTLDTFVYLLNFNPVLKAAPLMVVFWWAWFKHGERENSDREFLLQGIAGCFLAIGVARALAFTLPFRERPLRNPVLHFQLPYGMRPEHLLSWSSFPSDNAALFFALASSVLFISWRAGTFALLYVLLVIAIPRIYLGIHYPTDMLAGALLGIGAASLGKVSNIRTTMARPAMRWLHRHPGSFYACLFLITYQICETFSSVIEISRFFSATVKALTKLL